MPTVPLSNGPRATLGVTPDARNTTPDVYIPEARMATPQINLPAIATPHLTPALKRGALKDPNAIRRVEVSDRGAAQQAQAARNIGSAADAIGSAVMDYQVKVNATVVDDALNDARETARKLTWGVSDGKGGTVGGYKSLKGYDALKRPDDKPLDEEVAEQFNTAIKEIGKTKLSNGAQQRAFEIQVNELGAQLRQGASIHQSTEFESYHASVYRGAVENLTQDFALVDPGDMAGQRSAMEKIDQVVATQAASSGASAQELEVGQRAARSAAVSSMFDRVIADKKYSTAQALLNEWSGSGPSKIDANTATKMKLTLDGHVSIQLGEQLADDAYNLKAGPAFNSTDTDRAFNVAVGMESNNRQVDEKGKVITSDAGAKGVAQLMPDTAKDVAKSLGHPELADLAFKPTKEGEAANRLLGRAYFNQMLMRYKGDLPKAMAAYNAGPGRVDDALKEAGETGKDWRTLVPAETRAYVANGMRQFGQGDGTPVKPKKSDLYAAVDARTDDPDVRRAAYSRIDRKWSAAEEDERNGYETAYAQGLNIVRESGGDINAISPDLKAQIKPEQFTTLEAYAKNTVEGAYRASDPAAYYTAMSPTFLTTATPNQIEALRPELSESDYNTVRSSWTDAQAKKASQPATKSPESLDLNTIDGVVDTRLQYLGVDTHPKDAESKARLGAIRQFVHQYTLDAQRQAGKKFDNYADIDKTVNLLFTRNQQFKTLTLFGPKTQSVNVMTATEKTMPDSARKTLNAALKKGLGRDPSEAELLQAYMRSQFYTGR